MDDAEDPGSPQVGVSDVERDEVARRLAGAVGEGRLTLDEFTQRVNAVYEAKARDELEALTADIPAGPPAPEIADPGEHTGKRRWKVAVLGGSDYRGRWRVPAKSGYFAMLGGSMVDLRDALLDTHEIEITLVSFLGGSEVIVPRGVRVEVDATNVLAGDKIKVDEEATLPNSPIVRIRSYSFLAGNDVRHPKKRWRERT